MQKKLRWFILSVLLSQTQLQSCYSIDSVNANYSEVFYNQDISSQLSGFTRSVLKENYAVISSESRVWEKGNTGQGYSLSYLITPAMGARFTMYLGRLEIQGWIKKQRQQVGQLVFVLEGSLEFNFTDQSTSVSSELIESGGFVYFPPGNGILTSIGSVHGCGMLVYEMEHTRNQQQKLIYKNNVDDLPILDASPEEFVLRKLLPTISQYDFNVHVMDFTPGLSLVIKEVHRNQHGLIMMQGQGIYRLGDDWYPVRTGDVIWMAPFIPQWYAALGKINTRYIIFKDTYFSE